MRLTEVHPIILAGGLGSRLRRVAPNTAKPMIQVEGRPFIEWVLRWLASQGFRAATISTCHLPEQFESHFAREVIPDMQIRCVREPFPLGTGGAVRHIISRHLEARPAGWLVLNGDSLVPCNLAELLALVPERGAGALVARWTERAARYGSLAVDADGRLLRFCEKAAGPSEAGLINAGIYLFDDRLVRSMPDRSPLSLEIDVLPNWLAQQVPIAVNRTTAPFCDIGTEESLTAADEFVRTHLGRLS